tara:strand:- start:563 stop:1189 length:627 start_codon:yes stop_codon:yes gene_type:complete
MIYNDDFVWLHFPKCAGIKIEVLFENYFSSDLSIKQDLFQIEKDPTMAWHDSIADREKRDPNFKLGKRVIICCVRRLPAWLISRYFYEKNKSPHLDYSPELLQQAKFPESNGYLNNADFYINKYLPKEILEGNNKVLFIRIESFENDFKHVFAQFINISNIPDEEFNKKLNVSKKTNSIELYEKLKVNKTLYTYTPSWKRMEELAYGN